MKKTFLFSCVFVIVFSAMAAEDIVIANFDSDNYSDWKVEGNAFQKAPDRFNPEIKP